MSNRTAIRMRVLPRFPARITGTAGLKVKQDNLDLVVTPDFGALTPVPSVADGNVTYFWAWNSTLDSYSKITFENLVSNIQDVIIGENIAGLAAVSSGANKVPYFLDSDGNAAVYTVSSYVRGISGAADSASFLTAAGAATAAQGIKADSAVQPARQITAGSNLTGGGNLSADRSIALLPDISITSANVSSVVKTGTLRQVPGAPHDGLFLGGNNGLHIMCEGLPGYEGAWAVYCGTNYRSCDLSLAPSGLPSQMPGEDTSSIALQLQNGSGDGFSGERRGGVVMKKWGELRLASFRTSSDAGPVPYLSMVVQDRKLFKMADDNISRFTNELLAGGAGGNTVAIFENPGTNVTLRHAVTSGGSALIEHLASNTVDNTLNIGPNGLAVGAAGIGLATHRIEAAGVGTSQGAVSAYANDAAYVGEVLRISTAKAKASNFAFLTARANGDLTFNLRGDGNAFADGAWTGGGADYAEYFEWSDGNPESEDRIGFSVVLDGGKIRIAKKGEEPIGVVSATAFVVGDDDGGFWRGKYLRDDFGRYLMEEVETISWDENVPAIMGPATRKHSAEVFVAPDGKVICMKSDVKTRMDKGGVPVALVDGGGKDICGVKVGDDGNTLIPEGFHVETLEEIEEIEIELEAAKVVRHSYNADEVPEGVTPPVDAVRGTAQRRKVNPAYDASVAYESRESRKEWATVGLMGKLRVRKGQPTGQRWVKINEVSGEVDQWLVR